MGVPSVMADFWPTVGEGSRMVRGVKSQPPELIWGGRGGLSERAWGMTVGQEVRSKEKGFIKSSVRGSVGGVFVQVWRPQISRWWRRQWPWLEPLLGKVVQLKSTTEGRHEGEASGVVCVSVKHLPPAHWQLSSGFQAEFEGRVKEIYIIQLIKTSLFAMCQRRLYSALSSAVFARPLRNTFKRLGVSTPYRTSMETWRKWIR